MKPLTITLYFLIVVIAATSGFRIRRKRDLVDLAEMFEKMTELDPTDYIPYGNWCGYGGNGAAVDPIDECCENHDSCYDSVIKNECSTADEAHTIQYFWKSVNETVVCDPELSDCEMAVCTCDKLVVECINKNYGMYNPKHRFIKDY